MGVDRDLRGVGTHSLELRVLGPMQVVRGGTEVDLGGPRGRLILALLVADVDQVVSTDRLIEGVWGDDPPNTARKAAQVHISNLRRAVGDEFPLRTAPGGYVLQSSDLAIDSLAFESDLQNAVSVLRTDPTTAIVLLGDALAMWRGPSYADLNEEPGLQAESARLSELRLQALEYRVDASLRAGRHSEVIGELEVLTADHPYRERFREFQMLALYRAGRQTEALRAYDRTRSILVEELGIEPSPALRALQQQILEQSTDLELDDQSGGERYAFLATDIEDSTSMWESEPDLMQSAVARHDRIMEEAVTSNSGRVFKGTGDGVFAVFGRATDALRAAAVAQTELFGELWLTERPIRVRMAVDEGLAAARGDDYFGPALNRVSRIMSSGHGGQVLLPASLVQNGDVSTRPVGSADYKGVGRLEVVQLQIEGLPDDFPGLRTDRAPTSLSRSGFARTIRGYEIRERLGERAQEIVYRSYQASVGREVAVKVISPEFASQPGFVKRFEAEAQLVAQLEHPHIVSLYDYWRDPEGAYLVMQLMRGGTLAASLERSPWRPPAALLLLDQVGTALEYAHRHGVVHGDLKPANVLLDDEGNAFLSDFRIASQHVGAIGVPVDNSVAYVSPEELAGRPVGPAADVYGLALLTYEILTRDRPALGKQPSPVSRVRQDLPAALDSVLARGAHVDPDQRFSRISDFLRSLRQVFGAEVTAARHADTPTDVRNPYKGLRAFAETDANDYFGRDELVDDLIAHVGSHRLTAVVGPSGSGKSSLVRAGLIPAVRRGALGQDGDVMVTEMFPGSFPFEELEAALLRVAVERHDGLLSDLLSDDRGLLRVSKQILPNDDTELLLVIDQFEELFSLTTDDRVRSNFLANLVTVAADERSRVRVVLTLRADYFDRPLAVAEFGALLREALIPVAMPGDQELGEAIARPAAVAGLEFEPGLITRIADDVVDEPGALPLLQHALTELVNEREGSLLTSAGYERTGGVNGALAARAEEIYGGLAPGTKVVARDVFLRLVSVGEDANDTRRRVRRSELEALGLSAAPLDVVLTGFGAFRLLSFDHDPVTRGPTVEVAHEALIREWPRYRKWIDERREDLLLERRLEAATVEWEAHERDASFLFSGGQLEQYESWADATDVKMTAGERDLLDDSRETEDRSRAAVRSRRRRVLGMVSGLAVVAMVLALVAVIQMRRADANANEASEHRTAAEELALQESNQRVDAEDARAEAEDARADAETATAAERSARSDTEIRSMVSQSAALAEDRPSLAMLIAMEAYQRDPSPVTLGGVLTPLQRTDGYIGLIPSTRTSSNDQWIGLLDDETIVVRTLESVDLYNLDERRLIASNPSVTHRDLPSTFTPGAVGAGRFITLSEGGAVLTIDPGSTELRQLASTPARLKEPERGSASVALNLATAVGVGADGSAIVGFGDGGIEVWSGPDLEDRTLLGHTVYPVISVALNSDSSMAATQDRWGNITMWDVQEGDAHWTWALRSSRVAPADVETGLLSVARDGDGTEYLLELVDGRPGSADELPEELVGIGGELQFSNDDSSLYSLTAGLVSFDTSSGEWQWEVPGSTLTKQLDQLDDGQVLWGNRLIRDGIVVHEFDGIAANARSVAVRGGSVVIALDTEGLNLWSLTGDQLIAAGNDRGSDHVATVNTDGERIASFDPTQLDSARVTNTATGMPVATGIDNTRWLAYTGDSELVEYTADQTVVILDSETFEPLGASPERQTWGTFDVSPDRTIAAIGNITDTEIRVIDLETGEVIKLLFDNP
ncbi:MAG: hypothetical protein DRJ50_04095, partial [Actinobacteria bacterium]